MATRLRTFTAGDTKGNRYKVHVYLGVPSPEGSAENPSRQKTGGTYMQTDSGSHVAWVSHGRYLLYGPEEVVELMSNDPEAP